MSKSPVRFALCTLFLETDSTVTHCYDSSLRTYARALPDWCRSCQAGSVAGLATQLINYPQNTTYTFLGLRLDGSQPHSLAEAEAELSLRV